jgi:hypothetical protein
LAFSALLGHRLASRPRFRNRWQKSRHPQQSKNQFGQTSISAGIALSIAKPKSSPRRL